MIVEEKERFCGMIFYYINSSDEKKFAVIKNGKKFGFPKGSINEDENDLDCALKIKQD